MGKITLPPRKNIEAILAGLPKGVTEYSGFPCDMLYKDMTLEELELSQRMRNKLCYVKICFKYGKGKHEFVLYFFPEDVDGDSLIQLLLNDSSSKEKIRRAANIIASYYSVSMQGIHDFKGFFTSIAIPKPKKFTPKNIAYDIKNFFLTKFKNVRLIEVLFENVTEDDLALRKSKKSKNKHTAKITLPPQENIEAILRSLPKKKAEAHLKGSDKKMSKITLPPEKNIKAILASLPKEIIEESFIRYCDFEIVEADTYGLGVQALRDSYDRGDYLLHPLFVKSDGSTVVRPLTFKENMEAMVNDYETLYNPDGSKREGRWKLFNAQLDSCTGIALKARSTKFKIIQLCQELVLIDKDFNEKFLPIDYDSLQGIELNSKKGKYNKWLTKEEVLNNEAWRAAAEDDMALLKNYADIIFNGIDEIFNKMRKTRGMAFFVCEEGKELEGLFQLGFSCNILFFSVGSEDLDELCSLLACSQVITPTVSRLGSF